VATSSAISPDGDGWRTSGDFAFKDQGETEATGVQGRLEWNFDNHTQLVAITDWKNYQKALFIDVDSAPVNQLANFGAVDADSLSQEIRPSGESDRTRWVAGVYYLNIDTDSDNGLKAPVKQHHLRPVRCAVRHRRRRGTQNDLVQCIRSDRVRLHGHADVHARRARD
jgi:hypothetical protein